MLYQQINNEALDEDRRADLEVIRRLKKNYIENKEAAKPRRRLDQVMKNAFRKELALFEKYVYKTEALLETIGVFGRGVNIQDATLVLSDIVITYNSLVSFLGKINFNQLDEDDKNFIKNKITGNLAPLNRIIAALYEKVPDFVLLPITNIVSDIELKNYKLQSFTDEPEREFRENQRRLQNLRQAQDDRERGVQDDEELFEQPNFITLRQAIEDYAAVNPGEPLDGQRAFEDISSAFIQPITDREYMDALATIRARTRPARRARRVALAQQELEGVRRRALERTDARRARMARQLEGADDEFQPEEEDD